MLDELERARFVAAVRQGLDDANAGRLTSADEAFAAMQRKYEL